MFEKIVEPSVVAQTYASLADAGGFGLGDVVQVQTGGRRARFVLSKNTSGGALAVGDALTHRDFATAQQEQDAVVYTVANYPQYGGANAKVKGDTDAVGAAVAENEFAGAIMGITVGTGIGQFAQIIGNEAAGTGDKLTSYIRDPFGTALAATDDYVIVTPDHAVKTGALAQLVTGIAPVAVADGYYFWRCVEGLCFAKVTLGAVYGVDGTSDGLALSLCASATAGELDVRNADGEDLDTHVHVVGYLMHKKTATTGTLCLIWLNRCPLSL